VTASQSPCAMEQARRSRTDSFAVQKTLDVSRKGVGRLVTPFPVFLQRLHEDPVQFAG
jgi:hypothetical protein